MKFQNCILINFERTDGRTDGRTHGQVQSNMPLQLFLSWGHNKTKKRSKRNPTGKPGEPDKQPKHQASTLSSIDKF